jgi:hypothetical protein
MPNNQNSLFSTKGFYLGVAIFLLGLGLMIGRVILDIQTMQEESKKPQQITKSINLDSSIASLQKKLDEKIAKQEESTKVNFDKSIPEGALKIYEHNPINNPKGIITAVEFIDYGCPSCLVDANFTHRILKDNDNVKLISKLNNTDKNKQLHIANLASLVAAKENKYFTFREHQLTASKNDLNEVIDNLEKSNVSLRSFRRQITQNPDMLLHNLALDIAQAEHFNINSYAIFINDRMFSDDPKAEYNLKDITVYLNNL